MSLFKNFLSQYYDYNKRAAKSAAGAVGGAVTDPASLIFGAPYVTAKSTWSFLSDPLGRKSEEEEANAAEQARAQKEAQLAPLRDIAQKQYEYSQKLESEAPQMKQTGFAGIAGQKFRDLSGNIENIRSGANARGLLFSGIRQGQEAGAAAQTAGQLATARTDVNQAIDEMVNQSRTASMGAFDELRAMEQAQNDQSFQDALQRFKERQAMFSSIGGAAGTLGGAYAGKKLGSK